MYNRYRILKDGIHEFHTFKTNRFNHDEWLEDDNSLEVQDIKKIQSETKLLEDAKLVKEESLSRLTVTITSGKVFYADPNSRTDLVDVVIEGMLNNMPDDYQTEWKTVSRGAEPFELVTFAELKEAKRKALEAKASIIGVV